jgi:uncharacterized membrane protein YkvA (DUF1232 family)
MYIPATNCTKIKILTLTQIIIIIIIINKMEYCVMPADITPKILQDLVNIQKRTC